MKRIFLLLTGLLIGFSHASSLRAQTAVGLRITPDGAGFTGKFFADRNLSFEGQLNAGGLMGGEGRSVTVVALMEYNIPLPDPSWKVFFGGGLHAGAWRHDSPYYNEGQYRDNRSEGILGIDGIGGVEYVFKKVPIGLSADFKPAINLVSNVDFFSHNIFGLGARYYLGR